MKQISLSKGKYHVIVDDNDFAWLNEWKWYFHSSGYCYRQKMANGTVTSVFMHREILRHYGIEISEYVDHVNHDRLDNRKENLRVATNAQNQMNRSHVQSSSGYKGVTIYRNGKWRASAKINQKNVHLGYFVTKEEAAIAYNVFAHRQFGSFACLNLTGGTQ